MLNKFSSIAVLVVCLLAGLALVTFEPQPLVHAAKKDSGSDDDCNKKQCGKDFRANQDLCDGLYGRDAPEENQDPVLLEECLATADACKDACFNLCHFPIEDIATCDENNQWGFSNFPSP